MKPGRLGKIVSRRFPQVPFANVAYKTDAELAEEAKAEVEKFKANITELTTKVAKVVDLETRLKKAEDEAVESKKAADLNQKALDELIVKQKANPVGAEGQKDFGQELYAGLTKQKDQLTARKDGGKNNKIDDLELKVVGNLSSSGSLTGSYFVPPTIIPGVFSKPYEMVHVRDFVPVGQTNSNLIRYIQDNGRTTSNAIPTVVAEGATKPQMDRSLAIVDSPVRKIATYFRVPEEMIDDIPYISTFLSQVGVQEVMIVEDAELLYGDGTGQHLNGLFTQATAFARATGVGTQTNVNNFDVIGAARLQIRNAFFSGPVICFVSPADYYVTRFMTKDTTHNYIFLGGGNGIDVGGAGGQSGSSMYVDGTRVVENTNIAAGDFLCFDPSRVGIFDRMGTTVRFYDQYQDNAIKNLITIVIEKRLALNVYYTKAVVKGTFSTAITALQA